MREDEAARLLQEEDSIAIRAAEHEAYLAQADQAIAM